MKQTELDEKDKSLLDILCFIGTANYLINHLKNLQTSKRITEIHSSKHASTRYDRQENYN